MYENELVKLFVIMRRNIEIDITLEAKLTSSTFIVSFMLLTRKMDYKVRRPKNTFE